MGDECLQRALQDSTVRCIVLRANGKYFSAGHDLSDKSGKLGKPGHPVLRGASTRPPRLRVESNHRCRPNLLARMVRTSPKGFSIASEKSTKTWQRGGGMHPSQQSVRCKASVLLVASCSVGLVMSSLQQKMPYFKT